jgi:membrane protease YdiL (CAAX protease family)
MLLALYGNAASIVLAGATPADAWPGIAVGLLPAAGMVIWGRRMALLLPADLGLQRRGLVRSAALGLLVALALALPVVVFLHAPPFLGRPITHVPLNSLSAEVLVWRALAWMPLDTAVPEEVAFRGVLLAALRQRFDDRQAVLGSAIAFMVWHAVIVVRTLGVTNVADQPVLMVIGLVGTLGSVFVGGIVFALLRLKTGNLSGSIVAHWAFNATLLLGLSATHSYR